MLNRLIQSLLVGSMVVGVGVVVVASPHHVRHSRVEDDNESRSIDVNLRSCAQWYHERQDLHRMTAVGSQWSIPARFVVPTMILAITVVIAMAAVAIASSVATGIVAAVVAMRVAPIVIITRVPRIW
jgi:Flp pilus assembly protein TadB